MSYRYNYLEIECGLEPAAVVADIGFGGGQLPNYWDLAGRPPDRQQGGIDQFDGSIYCNFRVLNSSARRLRIIDGKEKKS